MQVSVVGVTGARATVNPHVKDLLKEIRKVCIYRTLKSSTSFFLTGNKCHDQLIISHISFFCMQVSDKAVAVGFGISTPEHVSQVKSMHVP
jgi:tryptophan synthase alpha subunit